MLTLPAFAKINLGLKIVGRRPDGYHELRTVFQTLTLHDRLHLDLMRAARIEVRVPGGGAPAGRKNLVYQALAALGCELGVRGGVYAEIEKTIPAASGLGGGSSDAAVALLGYLRLLRRKLPAARLAQLAAGLGSDVPFFLVGGRVLAAGRGEALEPVAERPHRSCLLVVPPLGVETRLAYRWAASRLTKWPQESIIWRFCERARSPEWGSILENDFEKALFRRFPRLGKIKRKLQELGAEWASLSGSGSAVYGLFRTRASAETAAFVVAVEGAVYLVATLDRRAYQQRVRTGVRSRP